MTKAPRLLDLFSGAGGGAVGYARAGFRVTGVDIAPQPRYPYDFIQDDAITFPLDGYDAYHASAPCQDHSPLSARAGLQGTGWMLAAIRERLEETGKPFILENVPGAPMRADVILCGHMFGLRTRRHRWFEVHGFECPPLEHAHRSGIRTASRRRRELWDQGWDVSITGDVGTYLSVGAMGIDWMNGNELSQAIPPAYTEYVGTALYQHMTGEHHDDE